MYERWVHPDISTYVVEEIPCRLRGYRGDIRVEPGAGKLYQSPMMTANRTATRQKMGFTTSAPSKHLQKRPQTTPATHLSHPPKPDHRRILHIPATSRQHRLLSRKPTHRKPPHTLLPTPDLADDKPYHPTPTVHSGDGKGCGNAWCEPRSWRCPAYAVSGNSTRHVV